MIDSFGVRADDGLAPHDAFIDTQPAWVEMPCEVPRNLDSFIRADQQAVGSSTDAWAGERWYRGVDGAGVVHIFRFQRGGPIELWHRSLSLQGLRSVCGPFRSQRQAHAGARPASRQVTPSPEPLSRAADETNGALVDPTRYPEKAPCTTR